jgi:hypothetical protein
MVGGRVLGGKVLGEGLVWDRKVSTQSAGAS